MRLMIVLLCLSNMGCGWLIAGTAVNRHYNVREREVEYRHQERMRELDIQERQLQRSNMKSTPIIRDNPF